MAFIIGTFGNDVLDGTDDADTILGLDGDDLIVGRDGDDFILAGWGDDQVRGGRGNDFIHGGLGNDILSGGRDDDTLFGGLGDDLLEGDQGDDALYGGFGQDILAGGDGDDALSGGSGSDVLDGGTGSDTLDGGAGDDELIGGSAPQEFFAAGDSLYGGTGNDELSSQGGSAILVGGPGDDELRGEDIGRFYDFSYADYSGSPNAITANLTSMAMLGLNPGEIADGYGTVDRVSGMHVLRDTAFDDLVHVDQSYATSLGNFLEVRLSEGDDQVTFSNVANARISYKDAGGGVVADLATGMASDINPADNFIGDDVFMGANQLRGSDYDDEIYGSDAPGQERLRGSDGADLIDGRGGIDRIDHFDSPAGIVVDLSAERVYNDGFGNVDTVLNIENVAGTIFDDTITGSDVGNTIFGFAGDDVLNGLGGNDVIFGDFSNAEFSDGGFGGHDTIDGGAGDDFLVGGVGNDVIDGGTGADNIQGGDGDDVLAGGTAPELFFAFDRVDGGLGNDIVTSQGGPAFLIGGPGNDTLRSEDPGASTFDFTFADYATSPSAIVANLTAAPAMGLGAFQVADGYGTVDTLDGVHVLRDTAFDDQVFVDSAWMTSAGNFLEVRLSQGDDYVEFTNVATARVSFQSAGGGVSADLATGTATDVNPLDSFIGNDTFVGANSLRGSNFDDELFGTDGPALERLRGSAGNDLLDGGLGPDRIEHFDSPSGIVVDLSAGMTFNDGFGTQDVLVGIEQVFGSEFGDTITGDANFNLILGFGGDDIIEGGGNVDVLLGGDGDDTYVVAPGAGVDQINDFIAGAGTDDAIDLTAFGLGAAPVGVQAGANTVIDLGGGDTVLLLNVAAADLHADDFII